ncbi:MAG: hypothetical protein EZS28_020785 [Streblomastix strix]|uniref:Uncharacterized protein n=1 Tax=Streblomastix strix TaxID=222440 RepID=A0A5J4VM71_9EUKA|nr:MAG: hypothetical protein EZS28_020785 [Streblomastix strix]
MVAIGIFNFQLVDCRLAISKSKHFSVLDQIGLVCRRQSMSKSKYRKVEQEQRREQEEEEQRKEKNTRIEQERKQYSDEGESESQSETGSQSENSEEKEKTKNLNKKNKQTKPVDQKKDLKKKSKPSNKDDNQTNNKNSIAQQQQQQQSISASERLMKQINALEQQQLNDEIKPTIDVHMCMQVGLTLNSDLNQKQQVYNQQILQNALQMVVQTLKEENIDLRRTYGAIATSFIETDGLENSFQLIAALAESLDVSQPQTQIEGTVGCLLKIIENNQLKCGLPTFESQLQEILEKLFIFAGNAIQAQNVSLEIRVNILKFTLGIAKILAKQNDRIFQGRNLLQLFIQALTTAAQSPDNAIKCEVIEGFSSILDMQVMKQNDASIQPFLIQISQFILSNMDESKVEGDGAGEVIGEALVLWQV